MKKPGAVMALSRSQIAVAKGSKGSKASALLTSGWLNVNARSFCFLRSFPMKRDG